MVINTSGSFLSSLAKRRARKATPLHLLHGAVEAVRKRAGAMLFFEAAAAVEVDAEAEGTSRFRA